MWTSINLITLHVKKEDETEFSLHSIQNYECLRN